MFQIKKTEYFFKWYKRLKDVGAQKKNEVVVLLLAGGDKSTQQKDIEKAKELKNEKK